jgi:hypothetical protein
VKRLEAEEDRDRPGRYLRADGRTGGHRVGGQVEELAPLIGIGVVLVEGE